MYEFLLVPLGVITALGIFYFQQKHSASKEAKTETTMLRKQWQDTIAFKRILASTPTNNNYNPIGNVLADLDLPKVTEILGGEIQISVEDILQ